MEAKLICCRLFFEDRSEEWDENGSSQFYCSGNTKHNCARWKRFWGWSQRRQRLVVVHRNWYHSYDLNKAPAWRDLLESRLSTLLLIIPIPLTHPYIWSSHRAEATFPFSIFWYLPKCRDGSCSFQPWKRTWWFQWGHLQRIKPTGFRGVVSSTAFIESPPFSVVCGLNLKCCLLSCCWKPAVYHLYC